MKLIDFLTNDRQNVGFIEKKFGNKNEELKNTKMIYNYQLYTKDI